MNELFDTLCRMIEETGNNNSFRQAVIFAAWEKVIGSRTFGDLHKRAVPVGLNQKNLVVAVVNEDWKHHFESISSKIIFKINALLKQPLISSIDFYVDSAKFADRQEYVVLQEPPETCLDYVNKEIRQAADGIEDKNLRYQFLLAAGACLRRKEKLERDMTKNKQQT
jgi:hypothetical protein